ncbi:MAG: glycosyltransferase family 4 protein [Rubricoccaceae bacterium]|nr:glycosyltransferase family 4 protein [Rubricoccaceae bacterium]
MSQSLGLVHGYGLSGAGSNLWTRSIVRALCRLGHTVHLVCQESRPEAYEFVGEARAYDADGAPQPLFTRETPYEGRCVVHRPALAVLPTYVRPRRRSEYVFAIPDLDDDAVEEYVARNARVLARLAPEVVGFCVNHVVLSAQAAQRAKAETGVLFAVLPHGSAIEYVVKKDPRMMRAASETLAAADRVFALNGEMEGRLRDVFGDVTGLMEKVARMPVGVDTEEFVVAARSDRPSRVEHLADLIADVPRGRTAEQQAALRDGLRGDLSEDGLAALLRSGTDYVSSAPDADAEAKLRQVDWAEAPVALYVGRLIAAKGLPTFVAAIPEVAARVPEARFVIAGTGGLREAMEALVWAFAHGEVALARRIVAAGAALDDAGARPEPFPHAAAYLDRLEAEGRLDALFERAAQQLRTEHVVFTGFLDHGPLSELYAVADVGVFPSVVREASPLVVPEAAASGTLPIGTDHGGMGDSLRTLAAELPEAARDLVLLRAEPEHTVADLVERMTTALQEPGRYAEPLRAAAVARYDWRSIAARLAESLAALASPPA